MIRSARLSVFASVLAAGTLLLPVMEVPAMATDPQPLALTSIAAQQPQTDLINSGRGQYLWLQIPSQLPGWEMRDVYWRDQLQWGSSLEKSKGVYDFTDVEKGLSLAAASKGKFSFRIMSFCPGCGDNLTPAYVPRQSTGVPDWNSEVFLASWENLWRALGAKFDKDPRLGTIDIGGYGLWGEWGWDNAYGAAISDVNAERMMRAVINSFPSKHPLMNFMDPYPNMAASLSPRVGLRYDCVGGFEIKLEYLTPVLQELWKRSPVVGEWCPHPTATAALGYKNVLTGHLSTLSSANFAIPFAQMSPSEQTAYVNAYRAAGFRYIADSLVIPSVLTPGTTVSGTTTWTNAGVAPTYDTWQVSVRLYDAQGRLAVDRPIDLDLKALASGSKSTDFQLPIPASLGAGTYSIAVAVIDPSGYLPAMQLPIEGKLPDGSYALGKVSVAAPTPTPTVAPTTHTPAPTTSVTTPPPVSSTTTPSPTTSADSTTTSSWPRKKRKIGRFSGVRFRTS